MTDTITANAQAEAERIINEATGGRPLSALSLYELGDLHRAMKLVLGEVKSALEPAMVTAAERGMRYLDLAHVSGYGSFATIARIMRDAQVTLPRGPRS
jgi:PIN domain nuclease of toxin-antitoxin system